MSLVDSTGDFVGLRRFTLCKYSLLPSSLSLFPHVSLSSSPIALGIPSFTFSITKIIIILNKDASVKK